MARLSPIRLLLPLMLLASPTLAADPLVEGARQCTQQFKPQEQANGIPTQLLAAISSVESGRWHDQLGLPLPWPWTINVAGKGYYFNSKAEAVAKTSAFLRSGITSIDVGCMQVNLKHHPHAFNSLEEAFDPAHNVAYGAQFLRSNYDEMGDWIKATAAYHSRTNKLGNEYLVQIEQSWNRIVGKVQQARARQGLPPAVIPPQQFNVASNSVVAAARTTPVPKPRTGGLASHPLSGAHAHIIQVSDAPRASGDVLVIRSAPSPIVKVADAEPGDMVAKPATDTIRRVVIDSGNGSANNGATNASTHFVFAN